MGAMKARQEIRRVTVLVLPPLEILWSLLLLLLQVAAATWSANPLRFFVTLFSTKVLDFSTKVFRFTTKGLVFSTKDI